jgi:hypothetical protein
MQKEINILVCCPDINDATSFYRGAGPLSHLRRSSDFHINYMVVEEVAWSTLAMSDLVFIQRPWRDEHLYAAKLAKQMGKKLWIDYDDDLFCVPTDNPSYLIYGRQDFQTNISYMIQMADAVSVSTQGLADNFINRGFRREYHVIQNALDLSLFPWSKDAKESKNTLAWRGSPSHTRDVLSVSQQIMDLVQGSEGIEFEFIGDRLWFLTDRLDPKKIKLTRPIGVIDYFKYIYELCPKFAMAPLQDIPFNRAKSNIAWLEMSWAGAVMLAPEMPEWMQPGVLTYKSPQHFLELGKRMLKMSEDERLSLREKSWKIIMDKYVLDVVNKKRDDLIRGLMK